jgi:transcriptional regulator with XRE-family HTH domain
MQEVSAMKHLNQLRIAAGYSIADLADKMHVDETLACRWLCGLSRPTRAQREQLARILWVDPQMLDDPLDEELPRRSERLRQRLTAAGGRILDQSKSS